jgi:hypothetical protein
MSDMKGEPFRSLLREAVEYLIDAHPSGDSEFIQRCRLALATTGATAALTDEQWRSFEESNNPFVRCGCGATMPCAEHYTRGVSE